MEKVDSIYFLGYSMYFIEQFFHKKLFQLFRIIYSPLFVDVNRYLRRCNTSVFVTDNSQGFQKVVPLEIHQCQSFLGYR